MDKAIELEKICKNFSNKVILSKIDLSVNKGEVIAIVGPSGCGKSTLLKCIAGLDKITSGNLLINGLPQSKFLKKERISIVLQKYSNFDWLTVEENILYPLQNTNLKLKEKERIVKYLLCEVGLQDASQLYINQISGGMQQRVAIARALAQDTEIIALDEPFGALDFVNRYNLQVTFKKLNSDYKKTVIFVTHDIDEAIFLADRIVVLCKRPATIKHIFDSPYKEVFDRDAKYSKDFVELKKNIEYIIEY